MARSIAHSEPFKVVRPDDPLPSITLKALLDFGEGTDDGRLIRAVATPWFDILMRIQRDPASIHQIDWRTWEEIIAGAYTREGFVVTLTPRSGDEGRDVIAVKSGIGCIKIIDQIKAYQPRRLVSADEVRSFIGAIELERNVSKGIITTTSDFAPGVKQNRRFVSLIPYRLEMKAHDELLIWLKSMIDKPA